MTEFSEFTTNDVNLTTVRFTYGDSLFRFDAERANRIGERTGVVEWQVPDGAQDAGNHGNH